MKLKTLLFLSLLFLCISASAQTAEDLNAKGDEYYLAGDFTNAVECFQKAAEQGLADAQYNLGVCYDNGDGVPQSYPEAVKWYRKAAEQGFAKAQYNLGVCYYNGQGVPQSYTEAVKWFKKAAEQGYADAINLLKNLGEM